MSLAKSFLAKVPSLSDSTKRRYAELINHFVAHVGKKPRYQREDVLIYLTVLAENGASRTYQAWCFTVLKTLFDVNAWQWWTRSEERRLKPKPDEPNMPYLRLPEMQKILEAVASKSPMIHAMVRIASTRPTRRIELQSFNRDDYARPYLRVKTKKGGEANTITLDEQTCNLLDEYLAGRKDEDQALFVSRHDRRVTLPLLSFIVRQILEEQGVYKRGMGWHSFRRGVTTALHKAGASERYLQEYGGWRSPTMPHRYIQLEPSEVDEKIRRIHPLLH